MLTVTEPSHSVFLSYASEDAPAAQRIADALRAAEIEVWLDHSNLRGGDAWDRKIRKEIHDCALFIPVISANAHARDEGYFRLEWKLATDRSHLMAPDKTFLIPVVIDNTAQTDERIPDRFRELQWARLPGGHVPPAFIDRVRRLLSPVEPDAPTTVEQATGAAITSVTTTAPTRASWLKRSLQAAIAVLVLGALSYLVIDSFWVSKKPGAAPVPAPVPRATVASAAFNPPPHSVAVLPFVNMSGDKEQEYFSDGLSEELLNDLARINELQVAARTSAFSFKGKDTDIGTIARKLNVGAVLEGSVRRSAHKVRVTAQLINAVTGFHLWSQTYDRDLGDVLKLQTEIADAVASALKVTLLRDVAATEMRVGGTRNSAAYDAYLRSASAYWQVASARDAQAVIAGYEEAVRLDPNFALAYAELSIALTAYARLWSHGSSASDFLRRARAPAVKAVALAPELAEGHLALFMVHDMSLDVARAKEQVERAVALAPGNARILRDYGAFAASIGDTDAGISASRRAVALDPLNVNSQGFLSETLRRARRYDEALAAFQDALALQPNDPSAAAGGWMVYYALGDFEKTRTVCEAVKQGEINDVQDCLALAYRKLGRQTDADTALARLKALKGNAGAYDYAVIYADTPKALEWLETALQLRDPSLINLKAEPLLDPLRNQPRFLAIERELSFPS
jgi:TolB-like protein/Tfp pilus assembly protein PilF